VSSSEKLAYNEEQRELHEAFKTTEPEEDDNPSNDFLVTKTRGSAKSEEVEEDERRRLQELDRYLKDSNNDTAPLPTVDPRGDVADGEGFLYDFLRNKRWIDPLADHDVGMVIRIGIGILVGVVAVQSLFGNERGSWRVSSGTSSSLSLSGLSISFGGKEVTL